MFLKNLAFWASCFLKVCFLKKNVYINGKWIKIKNSPKFLKINKENKFSSWHSIDGSPVVFLTLVSLIFSAIFLWIERQAELIFNSTNQFLVTSVPYKLQIKVSISSCDNKFLGFNVPMFIVICLMFFLWNGFIYLAWKGPFNTLSALFTPALNGVIFPRVALKGPA